MELSNLTKNKIVLPPKHGGVGGSGRGVNACQVGLGTFIKKKPVSREKMTQGARLTEREGAKAIRAMPIYTDHFSKGDIP